MKRSQLYAPTLRESPSEAETKSHALLLRAGYVRQLSSGVYSMLPLGLRLKRRVERIIREEMNAIGAQEFDLPSLQPAELWKASGRWNAIGVEMLRLRDRSGREMCLGMTHEEIFTSLARELRSYRELPTVWYQIARKFRDEPRPRGGLIRLREFTMKDSYSFALDDATLDEQFKAHEAAYRRIFTRCGLEFVVADASNGSMGGAGSSEFVAISDAGEDFVVVAPSGAAANLEVAVSALEPVLDDEVSLEPVEFETPDVHTIADLEQFQCGLFPDGLPATQQMKTLVMIAQGEAVVVLLRGDHQLNLVKLSGVLGTDDIRPAGAEETLEVMGANFGSLGPLGVKARIIADQALEGRRGLVSGANKDGSGFHGSIRGCPRGLRGRLGFGWQRQIRDQARAGVGTYLQARHALRGGARCGGARRGWQAHAAGDGQLRHWRRAIDGGDLRVALGRGGFEVANERRAVRCSNSRAGRHGRRGASAARRAARRGFRGAA